MIKKIQYFLILFFLFSCSANKNSEFWNKENSKIKKIDGKILFEKQNTILKVTNPNIKISLKDNYKLNSFIDNLSNNNEITNYSGNIDKFKSFKFSKINNFELFTPDLFITKNKNYIFFNGKGDIFKLSKDLKILWKTNNYKKKEKKQGQILRFVEFKDSIIVFDSLANYYSLDLKTGELKWKKINNSPFNSQAKIYENNIFVVDIEDTLRCYSAINGEEIWNYKSETSFIKSTIKSSLIIKDNKVIFINSLGDINALNLKNGNLLWQTSTQNNPVFEESFSIIYSDIISHEENIYLSNNRNEFFSINTKNGSVNWIKDIGSILRPTAVGKLIFTISSDGFLVILNKLNGQIVRSTNLKENLKNYDKDKNNFQGFVIAKDKILISQDGKIISVSIKSGQIEKIIKVDGSIISRPFISNKEMIIVSKKFIRTFK